MIWIKWFLKNGNLSGAGCYQDSRSGDACLLISRCSKKDDSRSGRGWGDIGIKVQSSTKTIHERCQELNDAL